MNTETKALVPNNRLATPQDRDLIKQIAHDIGKDVSFYVETYYPEAVKAASSTFLLSLRNHTYNCIVAAIDSEILAERRLVANEKHRSTIDRKSVV